MRKLAQRLRRSPFSFAAGEVVRLGGLVGTIAACDYTFAGREIYTVKFDCAERPVRTVLGDYLAPFHQPETRHRSAAVLPPKRSLRILPQIRQAQLLAA